MNETSIIFGVFALVFLGLFLIFRCFTSKIPAPSLAKKKAPKKEKTASLKMQKEPFVQRMYIRTETMLTQLNMSKSFYLALILLSGVFGFFIGKLYLQSLVIATFVGLFAMYLPHVFFTFRLTGLQTDATNKLESTMLILSNAYIANDDFIKAVAENIDIIEVVQPFKEFLIYVSLVDSNIETSLRRLESRVNNGHFSQWIDMLIMAQKDRSMNLLTLSVVDAMNDAKRAQMEVETIMSSVWREYAMLTILVFSTPILLRVLMRSWYNIIVGSFFGKILLVLLLIATVFSVMTAIKVSKPLDY